MDSKSNHMRRVASRCPVASGTYNFSLFFLTEFVARDRYYFTHLSLGLLFIVPIILILPLGLLNRLWYYSFALLLEIISIYFFLVSIRYWVVTNIA